LTTSTEAPNAFTPTGEGVVLVCSGGGLHGAAQAGMLEVLFEAGFSCEGVVGVSAGACNALYMAYDPTPVGAARLCEVWAGLDIADVFPTTKRAQITGLIAQRSGTQRQENFKKQLQVYLPVQDLNECSLPIRIAAVDSVTGEEVWFSEGPALEVLLASAALPGVFPPVLLDGRHLYDGGVVHVLPIAKALEFNPSAVLALDVTKAPPSSQIQSQLAALRRGIDHTRDALRSAQLAAVPGHVDLALVRAEEKPFVSLASEVEYGREAMRVHLEKNPLRAVERTKVSMPRQSSRPLRTKLTRIRAALKD
jgi:NTE family protein